MHLSGPYTTRNSLCYGCDMVWHGCVVYAKITGADRTGAINLAPTQHAMNCIIGDISIFCDMAIERVLQEAEPNENNSRLASS